MATDSGRIPAPAAPPKQTPRTLNRPVTKTDSSGTPHPATKQTIKTLGGTDPHVAANTAPKATPTQTPTSKRPAPKATPTPSSSPANSLSGLGTAEDIVNAQLGPILAGLDQTAKGYDVQAGQRADAIKNMTMALIQQLSGNPAQIGQFYDQAINTNTALADRSAQLLQQANPNNQVQSDLAAIGAPQAQQDQVANQLGQAFNGGAAVLYGTQAKLPGAQLLGDKAAAQTEATNHLASLAGFGEQNLMDALRQDNIFRSGLDARRAAAEAKRPGLLQQANMEIFNARQKQQSQDRLMQNQAFNQWATTQRLNQGAKALNLRAAAQSFDQWAKTQGLSIRWDNLSLSQQRTAMAQANAQAGLGLRTQTVSQGWQRLSLAEQKANQKAASGGFTPKQMQTYKGQALTLADRSKQGFVQDPKSGAITLGGDPGAKGYHPPLSYDQAVREGRKAGIPLSVIVSSLNGVYPVNYQVTPRGLVQVPKGSAAQAAATPQESAAAHLITQYIGVPYVWGGATPKGFDCSGLLQYVWARSGVQIPRTTYDQFKAGTPVAQSQLRPGDAVFFKGSDSKNGLPGHVGMYLGGGKFIEAPHSGAVVRIADLAGYPGYAGARRYA